jgi:hypothetical protein
MMQLFQIFCCTNNGMLSKRNLSQAALLLDLNFLSMIYHQITIFASNFIEGVKNIVNKLPKAVGESIALFLKMFYIIKI